MHYLCYRESLAIYTLLLSRRPLRSSSFPVLWALGHFLWLTDLLTDNDLSERGGDGEDRTTVSLCAALFVFVLLLSFLLCGVLDFTHYGGHKSASQYLWLQSFAQRKGWRAKIDIEGGKRSNRDEDDYKMILTDLFLLLPHLWDLYTCFREHSNSSFPCVQIAC